MKIELTGDNLQPLVAKAIFDALTPETREGLLVTAIQTMMAEPHPSNRFNGDRRTALQVIFDDAAHAAAKEVVSAYLAEPAQRTRLLAAIVEGVDRSLTPGTSDYARFVGNIADAVSRSIGAGR